MKNNFSSGTVYVRIKRNELIARHIESKTEASEMATFTTERLLVGQFSGAENVLTKLVKKVIGNTWLKAAPSIVMHPLEMTEGGLSQVEDRVLRELATGAGGNKIKVWVGPVLTYEELKRELISG